MLIYQGAASFEIWTGHKAPVEVMREAALNHLREGAEELTGASYGYSVMALQQSLTQWRLGKGAAFGVDLCTKAK